MIGDDGTDQVWDSMMMELDLGLNVGLGMNSEEVPILVRSNQQREPELHQLWRYSPR